MKKIFPGYYPLNHDELIDLWNECIFVLDTNTILNLLRYPKESRDLMLKILENIKGRIWIPHHVALEYHRNFNLVLYEQKKEYENLEVGFIDKLQRLITELNNLKHSNINTNDMVQTLEESREKIKTELSNQKEEQPDLLEIRDKITELIGFNIGREFSQEELDNIYLEGAKRYKNKIPPGFMDSKKSSEYFHNGLNYQAEYGDLIFWKQLLDYAKTEEVKSVILVSDDKKEDWIYEVKGEKKGPHPELIHEFNRISGGKLFYFYSSVQFVNQAEKFLGVGNNNISNGVIQEMEFVNKHIFNEQINVKVDSELFEEWKRQKRYSKYIRDHIEQNVSVDKENLFHYNIFMSIEEGTQHKANLISKVSSVVIELLQEYYDADIEIMDSKLEEDIITLFIRSSRLMRNLDDMPKLINKELVGLNFNVIRIVPFNRIWGD
ncbi:PIN-like domain-containing protein [Paenibacillus sp. Y5S-9]|uniref:PIN-like domain-containing protein n=1 Tax=Paenibacillus sp. Y5S-9 TaxID=3122489 RepID=UPI0030D5F842